MIELKHLKTLRALRKTGNLTRAADMLHLTQSAVSQQIRLLESNYGLLFERKSVPVAFTIVGQRLLELADTVIPAIEDAERNLIRLKDGTAGTLRIAVECHTCFDWLMPAMDIFRSRWPETGIAFSPLFHFEILALLARHHPLNNEPFLRPEHFATETLITYPVPDDMLDIMRQVLLPAGISPERRTSELTVAILQLVASGRGIAALPLWAVKSYLDKQYVVSKPVTEKGLTGKLYAATRSDMSDKSYIRDFIRLVRERSLCELPGIRLLN